MLKSMLVGSGDAVVVDSREAVGDGIMGLTVDVDKDL